ncbi:MAG: MBL fold metallo-hydrolase [Melioribacteraceae bacterium]|nr:MBL fold metallo-hydrolase [Melioribacteraceae bacterium]
MIKFLPLGGASDIGASCFYLNINSTGILLDCGVDPRKKGKESLPDFSLIKNEPLDYVLISHAHQDHIGALPFLVQEFPHVIVYSTYQTKEIAEIVLHNAANILAKENLEQTELRNYTHEEIDLLVKSIIDVDYKKEFTLKGYAHSSDEEIKITFLDAGHILGSASIKIEFENEVIIYTGDINLSDQSLMVGADLTDYGKVTTLILETTYGATDSTKLGTWESESKRFAKYANKILHNNGSILIPVFALGKTQEMLSTIYSLLENKSLTETNIYTGGVSKEISNVYDRNKFIVNYNKKDLSLRNIPQINFNDITDLTNYNKQNGIILASSGMILKDTPSFRFTEYWLMQKKFAIFIVGYIDETAPGYVISQAKKNDLILFNDKPQKVNCTIERFYFSAHSKREELIEIVKKLNPQKLILVHGSEEAKNWIGEKILSINKNLKVYSAEDNTQIIF